MPIIWVIAWKSMLENEGFKIDFNLRGMSEIDDIAKIFVEHTKDVLKKFSNIKH